jgi:hypothetical protein
MLANVRERVRAAIAAGESLEAFSAGAPLADLEPEWGDGFMTTDRFLAIVHADLSR